MIKTTRFIPTILLTIFAIVSCYSFYHGGIKSPVKSALNIKETDRRGGDFWGTFPAYFVDRYNPELRNKTIVKDWSKGKEWDYGPIQHLITLPLTFFHSIRLVGAIWLVLNYAFLTLSIWLVLQMFGRMPLDFKILVGCIWLAYWPLYPALEENVIEIFELFMIILSLYFLRRNKYNLSGITLGIAAMAKFLPLIFLAYFLVKGRFKAFVAMASTVAVIAIGTQLTLGWQNNRMINNFTAELKNEKYDYTYWRSQTIPSAIERLYSKTDYTASKIYYPEVTRPETVKWSIRIIIGSFLLGTLILFYIWRKKGELGLEYGIVSLIMFLAATHGEHYYLIFSLIGYSFALYYFYKKRNFFGETIFAFSYLMSGYLMQIREVDKILLPAYNSINREIFFCFLSFPTYGAVLLFSLLIYIYTSLNPQLKDHLH